MRVDNWMHICNNTHFTEDWVETVLQRIHECEDPSLYSAVVFTDNPYTTQTLRAICELLDGELSSSGRYISLPTNGRLNIDVRKLDGVYGEERRVFNHAGCEYTDVFILDETFTQFQVEYICCRLRSCASVESVLWFGEEGL